MTKLMMILLIFTASFYCYAYIEDLPYDCLKSDGVQWKCGKCRSYNWKQSPPYTCSRCGTPM